MCNSAYEQTLRASYICWWRKGKWVRLKPILEFRMIHPLYFARYAVITEMREKDSPCQAVLYLIIQITLSTIRIIFTQCAFNFLFKLFPPILS